MAKYWEQEAPRSIFTSKNVVHYYEEARKLSVARPVWKDEEGKERNGKMVAFDIAALLECDKDTIKQARAVFASILKQLDERAGV